MAIRTEDVDIDSIQPHPRNVREGDVGAIAQSLDHNAQYRAIVVSTATGNILAGNHTWKAAKALGWSDITAHLLDDLTPEQELRILLADNRTAERATYDDEGLAALLIELVETSETQLAGTGFDPDDLNTMLADLERRAFRAGDSVQKLKGAKWLADIDLYWTMGSYPQASTMDAAGDVSFDDADGFAWARIVQVICCLAVKSGWRYGVQSSKLACGSARLWPTHKPDFIDNEFKEYDHDHHMAFVNYWKPKYATVRDIMSQDQCDALGVPYYSLKEILGFAADAKAAGAQNVIVIPKVDVIDDIPEDLVLGFSVPSSYGGTPLPIEKFKGRPTHLLGGSPKLQISYVDALDGSVVSLDNNYMMLTAKYGTFWTPDNPTMKLEDMGIERGSISNTMYVALALGLGNFARYFQRQTDPDPEGGSETRDEVGSDEGGNA